MSKEASKLFEQFYRSYRLYVHGLCRKRFAQQEDAHDLEAVVWTEVYRFFERFQTEEPRRILYQLVTWRARDLYRKKYKEKEQFPELRMEDQELLRLMEQSSAVQPTPELRITLTQVLQGESDEDRELVFGRFVEGLSWEELAARFNVHRNTVQKRARTTLERLREKLTTATP